MSFLLANTTPCCTFANSMASALICDLGRFVWLNIFTRILTIPIACARFCLNEDKVEFNKPRNLQFLALHVLREWPSLRERSSIVQLHLMLLS